MRVCVSVRGQRKFVHVAFVFVARDDAWRKLIFKGLFAWRDWGEGGMRLKGVGGKGSRIKRNRVRSDEYRYIWLHE